MTFIAIGNLSHEQKNGCAHLLTFLAGSGSLVFQFNYSDV